MSTSSKRVRITVQLTIEASRDLAGPVTHAEPADHIRTLLTESNAEISPAFPGTTDPELATWFSVSVPERLSSLLLNQLQSHEAVLAAYIKPAEGLP